MYTTNPALAPLVTIAKVDATANDVPDEIAGFPTIKLFPAGGKSAPVDYSGPRTIEDLANFVKENGKHSADAYAGAATDTAAEPEADVDMPDADEMGKQAPAATEKVMSGVKEAAEAVKTAIMDSDDDASEHDEL